MRITRRFVWSDNWVDEYEEILSPTVDRLVRRGGTRFYLRHWDVRYAPGKPRVTEAVYEQWVQRKLRLTRS
jgi:hypothetical protein